MLRIHQPYIKSNKFRKTFAFASIGVFLLAIGILIASPATHLSSSVSAAEIKYMQQFTNPICQSMSTGETMDLIDPRGENKEDFQTYKIMKMPDGTCWMVENLRLGNDTAKIPLTANDTDLNGTLKNWTLPASYESAVEGHNGAVWNNNGNNEAMVKTGNNLGTSYKEAYGNYYSWCAATAGTCLENDTAIENKDAPSSICPKGWQLPVGTTGAGSFQSIYANYPNNATNTYWLTNQTVSYNGGTSTGYNGKRFGANSADAFFPAAGYVNSNGLNHASSGGLYWSRRAYSNTTNNAYRLGFYSSSVNPQNTDYRYHGFSVRCVADPTVTESDFTYGDIERSEEKDANVNVNVPSTLAIDAASGLVETADASKVIEGTATATISSNTEYDVTLHSTQPSLKDPTVTTAEISPVSGSNPVQPGNNSWGFWDGASDPRVYTLPITTEPQSFYNTLEDVTIESGDPAKKHTYYVGISISPSLPSGTYATDVIITASTK